MTLVKGLDDSSQKVLTQTMLNQEETFRNQMCSTMNHCPQQCRGTLKLHLRPFDVKVPANHLYINDAQDFSGGSYGRTPSQVSTKMKFDVHEHKVSSMEGLKLSPSVDPDS
ncbi:hypothetical protein BUALT_BualtUnG0003200 [Buddleja alternifolia]|uniref:Uncharacterized protein n=1 Tax=Buddleja alternifolia TaxID=168488 RepID=A0AAV6W4B2_9LAMI|nr:hypothetical protein BUALT_BualtUnG0003200 [Buddleja alternifolia]